VGRRVARSRRGHRCGARGGTDLGRSRGRPKADGAPPRREARVRKRASASGSPSIAQADNRGTSRVARARAGSVSRAEQVGEGVGECGVRRTDVL
jgi:hypothetical protein